jgi:hypothetical protein
LFEAGRIKKGDIVRCKIFAVKFELNDPHISVLAEFADSGEEADAVRARRRRGGGAADSDAESSSSSSSDSDEE